VTSEEPQVDLTTECTIIGGENLPNHSATLSGRGKYVRISGDNPLAPLPTLRTVQQAYRLAARIVQAAEQFNLPSEDGHSADILDYLEALMPGTVIE
jgi:hypothetical protein